MRHVVKKVNLPLPPPKSLHGAPLAGFRAIRRPSAVGMIFDGWMPLLRTLVLGVCAYIALVLLLRFSGKRTLSKLNAFDFIITVALGSTLATVILSDSTTLAQGVLAFSLLIGCQFVVTWSSVRWRWMRRLVARDPQLLLYRGQVLHAAMAPCRLTEDEVLAALRSANVTDQCTAYAVIIETDASLSVLTDPTAQHSTLRCVKGFEGP